MCFLADSNFAPLTNSEKEMIVLATKTGKLLASENLLSQQYFKKYDQVVKEPSKPPQEPA